MKLKFPPNLLKAIKNHKNLNLHHKNKVSRDFTLQKSNNLLVNWKMQKKI